MSDFPKGGDMGATRAWLNKKGFLGLFTGWEADALLGKSDKFIKSNFPNFPEDQEKAEILCGLLNFARKSGATDSSGRAEWVEKMKRATLTLEQQMKRVEQLYISLQARSDKISSSDTDHGLAIFNSLSLRGDIKEVTERTGSSIMSDELIEMATSMITQDPQKQAEYLVNLYTPTLMEIVNAVHPDLRLVNSEVFPWLYSVSGHSKSNKKPDLFSTHHCLIQYYPPYNNAPSCAAQRLFGKFASWECRSSIHCIWDGKWKISIRAFGEMCKYLQIAGEDGVDHYGVALKLKGIMFDKDEFWMIKSSGNKIWKVEKCKWSQRGSKELLIAFLQENSPWIEATNALCVQLDVTIVDYSLSIENIQENVTAFLGAGANGRVFRLTDGRVIKIVVGQRSDEVEEEYQLMVALLKMEAVSPFIFPVVERSFCQGEIFNGVRYAGFLLAEEGDKIQEPYDNALKTNVAVALHTLHSHDIIHGDPRIQNVLMQGGTVKWIDFRCIERVTTKISRRRDVEILYESLGGVVNLVTEEIEAYVNDPTVEKLCSVLLT